MPTTTAGLTVNGVRLYYEERGKGDPIVCIHGTGSSARLWEDAAAGLSHLGRVISYDRRGYGRSERPADPEGVGVETHCADVAALLDALDAHPAVIVGRSYGGEVAIALALRHPERVRAIVLLEGAPVNLSERSVEWHRRLRGRLRRVAEHEGIDAVGRELIADALGEGIWDELPGEYRRTFTENGAAILADLEGEWLNPDEAALKRIGQPVLLVAASDSPPELREPNEPLARALPDSQIMLVEGGHLIDPASAEVTAFIEEVFASA